MCAVACNTWYLQLAVTQTCKTGSHVCCFLCKSFKLVKYEQEPNFFSFFGGEIKFAMIFCICLKAVHTLVLSCLG